jgi:hypothetical protein
MLPSSDTAEPLRKHTLGTDDAYERRRGVTFCCPPFLYMSSPFGVERGWLIFGPTSEEDHLLTSTEPGAALRRRVRRI